MSPQPRSYRVAPALELAQASSFVEEVGTLVEAQIVPRPPLHIEGAPRQVAETLARASGQPMEVPAVREFVVREPVLIDQGIVLTADGYAIAETLYDHGPQVNAMFSYTEEEVVLNKPAVELGKSALLLKKKGQTNYGHWLVELLPRLFLHQRTSKQPAVFVHAPSTGFEFLATMYRETISLCCDRAEIVPVSSAPTRVESARLITGVSKLNAYFSPVVRDMAKSIANAAGPSEGGRKLFVSRSPEHGRGLANAQDTERFFQDRGFLTLEPSQLSIREQVSLFAAAEEICGIMGAGMSNSIFAPTLQFLGYLAPTYMFSIDYPNTSSNPARFYLDMDAALARSVTRILAGPPVSTGSVTPRDGFSIGVELLERWFTQRSMNLNERDSRSPS